LIIGSSCSISEPIKPTDINGNTISSKPTIDANDTIATSTKIKIPFNWDTMITRTDAAVIGKAIEILPAKYDVSDDNKKIYTNVIIEVESYLYGSPQVKKIAVRVNEGKIGDIAMISEDEAELKLGEKCVLFLAHPINNQTLPEGFEESSYYVLWGGVDSKYTTQGDTLKNSTGRSITLSDLEQKIKTVRTTK
jgi:hypothetical protein